MRQEIEEIPAAIRRLLVDGRESMVAGGAALRAHNPSTIVTIARGSSDHASAFVKYAIELLAGVPVASIGPSIVSIYGRELKLGHAAAIAVSFSPYASLTVDHAQVLSDQGVPIVSITDSAFSPLVALSKLWFEVAESDFGGFRSLSATMALATAIAIAIGEERRAGRK